MFAKAWLSSASTGNASLNADVHIRDEYDVAVIGAGPAGLTAAATCARAGVSTVLFDEQATPGGQIYRAITRLPIDPAILGEKLWPGRRALADVPRKRR